MNTPSDQTTIIRGGRIITESEDFVGDILIQDGTIAAIGARLDTPAGKIIDAAGCYVLPGCIDSHTHIGGGISAGMRFSETFAEGTAAAAFGGTTSIVNFVPQPPGVQIDDLLSEWRVRLQTDRPYTDVGFHLSVTDLDSEDSAGALARAAASGVTSWKVFMAYRGTLRVDDRMILKTMMIAAENGAQVLVHAENGHAVDVFVEKALAEGHTEAIWHARTRPPRTEGEATSRAIELAALAGAQLFVVHVTCREAIEPISRARAAGLPVTGETCTQYLFIDEHALEAPGMEGNKYIFTPPPRTKADQEALWNALQCDALSMITSDHCAYSFEPHKAQAGKSFAEIPNGAPGIEDRLLMIHHFGVNGGRISLNRMVELLSTSPAKTFGLYPRKGTIAIGSDADLVIFDPARKHTISAATHHMKTDYNLNEGVEVTGVPRSVLLRGHLVIEDGVLAQGEGTGEFVARGRIDEGLPRRQPHRVGS